MSKPNRYAIKEDGRLKIVLIFMVELREIQRSNEAEQFVEDRKLEQQIRTLLDRVAVSRDARF